MANLKRIIAAINYPRSFIVYLCAMSSKQKNLIIEDVERWNQIDQIDYNFFESLNWYLTYKKEFRTLIQHRLKYPSHTFMAMVHFAIARILYKPLENLYIYTKDIGGGFYILHGFSTIISAKKIGKNCRIHQQVTIGYKRDLAPILGDNVSITTGAKVLGGITMHNNSIAAAGAVVIKDVPENAVVGGVPAKVLYFKDNDNLDFQG